MKNVEDCVAALWNQRSGARRLRQNCRTPRLQNRVFYHVLELGRLHEKTQKTASGLYGIRDLEKEAATKLSHPCTPKPCILQRFGTREASEYEKCRRLRRGSMELGVWRQNCRTRRFRNRVFYIILIIQGPPKLVSLAVCLWGLWGFQQIKDKVSELRSWGSGDEGCDEIVAPLVSESLYFTTFWKSGGYGK